MERYKLYVKEGNVNRPVGAAKLDNPKPGQVFRVPVRETCLNDLKVLSVDSKAHKVFLTIVAGTPHFLRLLEHLVYKLQEARKAGVFVTPQIMNATYALGRICNSEGNAAECKLIVDLTLAADKAIEEKADG